MADGPILVTGASGKTGRDVITELTKRGASVRAFVRRAEAGEELAALGNVEASLGDLLDADSLARAIDGCPVVVHICPPMHLQETEIAVEIVKLCLKYGTKRLVLYSVLHPLLKDVFHHHNKLEAERYLINSGLDYTIVQPARYMQHLTPIWERVLETGIHDMPFSVDAQFNVVDRRDAAEATAIVATQEAHSAATYQLAGPEALSQTDMADKISDLTGVAVRAAAKSEDDFRRDAAAAGMPSDRIERMCIMNRHYDAHGLIGNPNVLAWILDRSPTDFESYVRRDLIS